ncbi:M12 family metallo-peptidase [Methanorbis rubei]|uniref:Peptidase M12B domain-containing protein n=1 Tax=Methanorbis rubei TaxID=3028300 RepID=A0AAE4MEF5_9EURY|nr:hypothetical protein [Methanocorpusculaceae archaeon Cs1]
MKWKKIFSTKLALLVLLLAALVMTVPVSAVDSPLFSISGKTTMVDSNDDISIYNNNEATHLSDYQLVTFANVIPISSDEISLPITLNGKEYVVPLTHNTFESLDDGIDSYYGAIPGITNSMMLITVSGGNTIYGSIHLDDETIIISPVQNQRSAITKSPLHSVYSSTSLTDSGYGLSFCLTDDDTVVTDQMSSSLVSSESRAYAYPRILIVTDSYFVSSESNWQNAAQQYIQETNYQLNRNDIQAYMYIAGYDSSKSSSLLSYPLNGNSPREAFKSVYSIADLNSYQADIGVYFSGYDLPGSTALGQAESPTSSAKRYAWVQMAADQDNTSVVTGNYQARVSVTIHEIGHLYGASHGQAFEYTSTSGSRIWTVMKDEYRPSHSWDYSSPSYHGDANHNNAGLIASNKFTVAGYI